MDQPGETGNGKGPGSRLGSNVIEKLLQSRLSGQDLRAVSTLVAVVVRIYSEKKLLNGGKRS